MIEFDAGKLRDLLIDFYTLTNIKICVFDAEGRELAYYPERHCAFCAMLHGNAAAAAQCDRSDRQALAECRERGRRYEYRCHMGLTECAVPILHGDLVLGFIMIGQVFSSPERDLTTLRTRARELGLKLDTAERLYGEVSVVSADKLRAAGHILDACAGYLYLSRLVRIQEQDMGARLDGFIAENLAEDLSVDRLCTEFSVSRTELYQLFRRIFGASVAEYVRSRRLKAACELLTDTDKTLARIAAETGLYDYNYFSKLFRRQMGVSPREYRKRRRNGATPL